MSLDAFFARVGDQELGEVEREALAKAVVRVGVYRAGQTIVEPGERSAHLHLITQGWAVRRQMLEDGGCQITDFFLAGDVCDLPALRRVEPGRIDAATQVKATFLDRRTLNTEMERHPRIAQALLTLALENESVLRTTVECFGLRFRREHLAHLVCELHQRLTRLGLVGGDEFDLPLTQAELGNVLGISGVHTNRVLQALRKEHLIDFRGGHLRILQVGKLKAIAEFDGGYLDLGTAG